MPDYDIKTNGWNEWAKYVLKTLEDLKAQLETSEKGRGEDKEKVMQAISDIRGDIKVLQARMTQRAAMSGGVVGFISSIVIGIIVFFLTRQ